MEIRSRSQLEVPLHRLCGLFHVTTPRAFLVLVKRWKDLWLLQYVSLGTKRAPSGKHDRLASRILCRRDALGIRGHLIFEDASYHLILLLHLE